MMQKTLNKIIDYAAAVSDADSIVLFGSMANGTDNIYSDIDLLIITGNAVMKRDIIALIKNFSAELSLKADVLVYSKLEIEKESETPYSFIRGILNSGRVVYGKSLDNYIEKR